VTRLGWAAAAAASVAAAVVAAQGLPTVVLAALPPAEAPAKPLIRDYVSAVVAPPPASLGLDPFYRKYADALGIPVVGSEKVEDAALLVARDIVIHMLAARPDVRGALVASRWRIAVMAQTELTTDIPEHRALKKPPREELTAQEQAHYDRIARLSDKEYWDRRARGLGGNPTSGAEENLLGYPGTRYYGENILVHEFAHAMHEGIASADPELFAQIARAFSDATAAGLWKGSYGATNAGEYWAEGVQFWFHSNFEYRDGERRIVSPEDLRRYDPRLSELLGRVYSDHRIPVDAYCGRELPNTSRTGVQNVLE
jgi:hypothetical protein